jgi:NOL1/NOP2/fmu family ribosome biogenesis protein
VAFYLAFIVLLLLIGLAAFLVYNASLKKLLLDLKYKTKIIEQAEITAKKYMKQNNTCHLYIKSPTRLSIEVKPEDFAMFFPGDEINIEYSFHAKVYFGYF